LGFLFVLLAVLSSCAAGDPRAAAAQVAPAEAQRLLTAPVPPILVDVRTGAEYRGGHLRNALHVPVQEFIFGAYAKKLGGVSKDDPIILYCRSGRRSGIAQQITMTPRIIRRLKA